MRRWLSILLLIVLPLQFSWAVAATYCQHEADVNQHFGHHGHKHHADGKKEAVKASLSVVDNDCAVCHAGCIAALTTSDSLIPEISVVADCIRISPFRSSQPNDLPDRPNWPTSA